jgi:hypothetical protein
VLPEVTAGKSVKDFTKLLVVLASVTCRFVQTVLAKRSFRANSTNDLVIPSSSIKPAVILGLPDPTTKSPPYENQEDMDLRPKCVIAQKPIDALP